MLDHSLLGTKGACNFLMNNSDAILNVSLARRESCGKGKLSVDTFNPVSGVDILDKTDLEAGSGSLTGCNGRVRKKVFPDLQTC